MRSTFRLACCLAACLCLYALTGVAQTVSPLPQEASFGAAAFPCTTKFYLVGEKEADKDAVSLLKGGGLTTTDKQATKLVIGEAGDKAVKPYLGLIPDAEQGYYLKVSSTEVVIAGRDEDGTFYGVQTFLQLMGEPQVAECVISDWPSVPCRGVIEGFYGNPWSHEDRLRQFDFYGKNKLNCYVYGPKDDPYHRAHWREPYPEEEAQRISELVAAAHRNKVQFVWAIHPGGDIRWTKDDSLAIVNKLQQMYKLGVRSFAVFFDDISGEGAKATKQAALLNYITDEFVRKNKDVNPLIICPTDYNKSWAGKTYLPTLGKELYPDIRIMWTGSGVVDMIETDDLEWVNPRIGRKAFIWLNYPVNDYCQSRLLMGKTYGNGLDISSEVSGFCSNPMEYAEASKVSLYSIADYTWNMPAYDPTASWQRAMRTLMPTSSDAFRFFCENNVDIGKSGHGLRREGESEEFVSLERNEEREAYFRKMIASASELLLDSVNQPYMLQETAPWVHSMALLGERGLLVCRMREDLDKADTVAFIGHYKAEQEAYARQKSIVSRGYEGSIVKAKPLVSGSVVSPWVSSTLDSLTDTYLKLHTYGADMLPDRSIKEGEYLITVDGKYLSNLQGSLAFLAERDSINPQRQQWIVEADPSTHRYKISNKQDASFLDERGTLRQPNEQRPFNPALHTFTLSRQGDKYSIRQAPQAGDAYLCPEEKRLTESPTEQTVFRFQPVE
ncbi:MAG: beta-N-acetylglucosaminidase domain-containing protein [Prevotellaceae bacterium]|nr:beta-N-acetylglucosaminidase domain-containing protein [Prevotellaceae bacterium]